MGSGAVATGRFVQLGGFTNYLRNAGYRSILAKYQHAFTDALRSQFVADFSRYLANDYALRALNANNAKLLDSWVSLNSLGASKTLLTNFDGTTFDFLDCHRLLQEHNLFQNMGTASIEQMTVLNRYTRSGNYVLFPQRGEFPELVLNMNQVNFDEYQRLSYQLTAQALRTLRNTNRLFRDVYVFRGRNYTLRQFKQLFHSTASTDIPLKGFQSCSKTTATPLDFMGKSKASPSNLAALIPDTDLSRIINDFDNYVIGKNQDELLVDVMLKIKSKNGIDIDDISDWGTNLGPVRHANEPNPAVRIQLEVLLEEGMFRRTNITIMEFPHNPGKYYIEVTLEELGTPLPGRGY